MSKNETPTAPAFESIALDALPEPARKGSNPETIALGAALIAATGADHKDAAVEGTIHKDRAAATTRAAALKRAVTAAGIPAGLRVSSRILAADGGSKVAIYLEAIPAEGDDAPDAEPVSE